MEATRTEVVSVAGRDRTRFRFIFWEVLLAVFAAGWLLIAVVEFPFLAIADSDLGTNSYSTKAFAFTCMLLTLATLRFVFVRNLWLLVAASIVVLAVPFVFNFSGNFDHGRMITVAVLITLAASDLLFHESHWRVIAHDLCAMLLLGGAYVTLYGVIRCDHAAAFSPAVWLVSGVGEVPESTFPDRYPEGAGSCRVAGCRLAYDAAGILVWNRSGNLTGAMPWPHEADQWGICGHLAEPPVVAVTVEFKIDGEEESQVCLVDLSDEPSGEIHITKVLSLKNARVLWLCFLYSKSEFVALLDNGQLMIQGSDGKSAVLESGSTDYLGRLHASGKDEFVIWKQGIVQRWNRLNSGAWQQATVGRTQLTPHALGVANNGSVVVLHGLGRQGEGVVWLLPMFGVRWLAFPSVVVMTIVAAWVIFRHALRCARNRLCSRDMIRHFTSEVSE